jgi:hypothetical protein
MARAVECKQPVDEKPSNADLRVLLYDYGYAFRYCNREGWIWYEFGIKNLGPADAKNVVVNLVEELFKVPLNYGNTASGPGWVMDGWPRGECTSRFGAISCQIGDIVAEGQYSNYWARFVSDYFRNGESRQHRVKITVSSSSKDLNPDNNIRVYERTIPRFTNNNGGCDWVTYSPISTRK